MKNKMKDNQRILICACGSLEHQMMFWVDDGEEGWMELYTEVHLTTCHGFFKRLWYGLRYAFGYKCRFGAWDEFLFTNESQNELKKFLKTVNEQEGEENIK